MVMIMTTTTASSVAQEVGVQQNVATVHIDTSLQIERCKEAKKAGIVEQAIGCFPFKSTSSYAKFEFKHAWLRDLVYIYNISQRVNRIEKLLAYIDDNLNKHPATHRRVSRCLQATVAFLSKVPGKISYKAAFLRLRNHIRSAILNAYLWWDLSVTHEFNGTGCQRASEPPIERAGKIDLSIPECKVNNIKCAVHLFFEKNKHHFVAIRNAIEALGDKASSELKKAREIIDIVIKNPAILCKQDYCQKLGDVLIAIDGYDMGTFAANNDKEWEIIAKTLGKELLNPVRKAKTESGVAG